MVQGKEVLYNHVTIKDICFGIFAFLIRLMLIMFKITLRTLFLQLSTT